MTASTRFSHRTTLSAHKQALFWQEKCYIIVMLIQGFAKMLLQESHLRTWQQLWHFSISKKVQLPEIRITEQPILPTKSKINIVIVRVIYFASIFAKNGKSNLILVLDSSSQNPKVLIIINLFDAKFSCSNNYQPPKHHKNVLVTSNLKRRLDSQASYLNKNTRMTNRPPFYE